MELIKMPPSCTFCKYFRYKKGAKKLYRCKMTCMKTNDIFELFEDYPYLHLQYAVRENAKETENDDKKVGGWHSAEEYFEKLEGDERQQD